MSNYQEIARLAQVSKITVSRVLNQQGYVSEATRKRVLDAVAALGYKPNPLVNAFMASLRSRKPASKGAALAYITRLPREEMRKNLPVESRFQLAQQRASALGYSLEVYTVGPKPQEWQRLNQILTARGIRGLILAHYWQEATLPPPSLPWEKYACVLLGHHTAWPAFHVCDADGHELVEKALAGLRQHGYSRVGLACPDWMHQLSGHRYAAAYTYGCPHLLKAPALPLFTFGDIYNPLRQDWPRKEYAQWLRKHKPQAVLFLVYRLERLHVRLREVLPPTIPVSLDLPRRGNLPGVLHDTEALCTALVDMLVSQLHYNAYGLPTAARKVLVGGAWHRGRTLPDRAEENTSDPG